MADIEAPKSSSAFSYRPEYRLKTKSDYTNMESAKISLHTRPFTLVLSPSKTENCRLGIVVTKKVDKRAVVRNKIKRQAREIFRLNRIYFKTPYDILFIARKSAIDCSFELMRRQVVAALWKHGFIKSKNKNTSTNEDGEQSDVS